ncbi:pilus assembly protein PilL [Cupriavidus alkaliphilus]|uniref:Pilus assembly protein PilL n=1 Tax=Cupriavidus alkaliphilus TaxID=942866 RepID=A0A7W4YUI5_9BURK|nr:pilus assembly protein PilL [Cupriavidus alkaliphilus]MBB3011249.1 hypothetical protein [Cupriavidus alkaliphilus]
MIRPLILSALVLTASASAMAADTDPLDFDYQIVARAVDRPALIFNDGLSTYIQPRPGQAVQADGALQTGPYWVVDGVPDAVRYTVNGQPVLARWKRANGFTSEPANPAGDLPRSLAGISGRLALIGSYTTLPVVRSGRSSLPLAQMIKSIAPAGWTGTAQKDIPLTEDVAVELGDGENWLQALARVLERRNLYAEVDFIRRNIALRAAPPKGFSVVAEPARQDGPLQAASLPAAGTPEGPTLASAFGAVAIRDNKQGRIEIRFEKEPKDLVLRDESGSKIWTNWEEAQRVLSFSTVDRFTATADGKSVQVDRAPEIEYVFPRENAAGLEMVFEKDGVTYLSFAKSMVSVSVFGDEHKRNGEQKDRYYKFDGIAARLTVIADGNVVYVDRVPQVRFKEQPGKVAL